MTLAQKVSSLNHDQRIENEVIKGWVWVGDQLITHHVIVIFHKCKITQDSYFFQDSVSRATFSGLVLQFLLGFCVQGYYFWAGTPISSRILCPGLLFPGWYSYFFQDSVSRATISELLFLPGFCVQGYYFWAGTYISSRILCPGLLFLGWYSYFFQDSVSRATVSGLVLLFLPGFCVQVYFFWAGTPISSRILCPGLLFLGWNSYFFQDFVSRSTISGLVLLFLPGFCVQVYYFWAGTPISSRILCPGLLFLGWDSYFFQDSVSRSTISGLGLLFLPGFCVQGYYFWAGTPIFSVSRPTISGLGLVFLPGFCVQGYYFWAGTRISLRILCPGLLFLGWDSYFFPDILWSYSWFLRFRGCAHLEYSQHILHTEFFHSQFAWLW